MAKPEGAEAVGERRTDGPENSCRSHPSSHPNDAGESGATTERLRGGVAETHSDTRIILREKWGECFFFLIFAIDNHQKVQEKWTM